MKRWVRPHGSILCALWHPELPRVLGILADLIGMPRIHTDNHAVSWLYMLEGELERCLNFVVASAHPTCRQYLEAQARLVYLPDHFGHGHRVRGKERVADLGRDDGRHFLKFFGRPGEVIEAGHEKIHVPAFIGDLLDAIGIMGGNTSQHTCVFCAFDKITNLPAFTLSKQPVGNAAMMDDGYRPSVLNNLLDRSLFRPASEQADELYLRSSVPQLSEDIDHFVWMAELVGVDTSTFAPPKELDRLLRCEVPTHVPVHDWAHVGITQDRIASCD